MVFGGGDVMGILTIPRRIPLPMLESRRARNGLLPHHASALYVAQYSNFVTQYCRKLVFQKVVAMTSPSAISVATTPWRWLCRTGEASTTPGSLKMRAVATAVAPCSWSFTADDGVSPVTSSTVTYVGDYDDTADDVRSMGVDIDVDPDTEYECYITVTGLAKPPLSLAVFEVHGPAVDTDDDITVDHRAFHHKSPIYDATMQDLVESPHDLWKHNGAQLLAISRDTGSSGWIRPNASYINMLDPSWGTSVSSSSPGFNLRTTYLHPYHTTDIAAVLGVYANNDNSAGGDVALVDSAGTLGTLSSFSTAGEWKTTAVTLTGGSDQKVDVHFRGDGTNDFTVHAVSIYVYET